jgi:hypothetical protein
MLAREPVLRLAWGTDSIFSSNQTSIFWSSRTWMSHYTQWVIFAVFGMQPRITLSSRTFWPLKMDSIGCPELRYRTNHQRCVTSQKNVSLIYIAAEAWNHGTAFVCNTSLQLNTSSPLPRLTWLVVGTSLRIFGTSRGRSGTGSDFSEYFGFPCQYYPTNHRTSKINDSWKKPSRSWPVQKIACT